MMASDEWMESRLAYLRGLKAPSEHQQLLILLADKPDKTSADERKIAALVKAEKASERATKARADAARILNAEKTAQRKARDRELYQTAGLLILAGLVDSKTGKPTWDRGELLGALASMAATQIDDAKKNAWKTKGDALLAKDGKHG